MVISGEWWNTVPALKGTERNIEEWRRWVGWGGGVEKGAKESERKERSQGIGEVRKASRRK